jgi:hypothetical protein
MVAKPAKVSISKSAGVYNKQEISFILRQNHVLNWQDLQKIGFSTMAN